MNIFLTFYKLHEQEIGFDKYDFKVLEKLES